jgi:hypothetical protein
MRTPWMTVKAGKHSGKVAIHTPCTDLDAESGLLNIRYPIALKELITICTSTTSVALQRRNSADIMTNTVATFLWSWAFSPLSL